MELFEEIITTKKDYINYQRLAEPKTGVLFKDFINNILIKKSKRLKDSSNKNYKILLYHLDNFSKEFNCDLYINSINEEFLDDFIYYLKSLGRRLSYINSLLSLIKAMCRKAANYGYVVDARISVSTSAPASGTTKVINTLGFTITFSGTWAGDEDNLGLYYYNHTTNTLYEVALDNVMTTPANYVDNGCVPSE